MFYILDGHQTVREPDLLKWAAWFESNMDKRHVADEQIGDSRVSTVFLGLDHQFLDGAPLLFETMVFSGPLDGKQDRCETWEQAEAQHAAMVAMVERVRNESRQAKKRLNARKAGRVAKASRKNAA